MVDAVVAVRRGIEQRVAFIVEMPDAGVVGVPDRLRVRVVRRAGVAPVHPDVVGGIGVGDPGNAHPDGGDAVGVPCPDLVGQLRPVGVAETQVARVGLDLRIIDPARVQRDEDGNVLKRLGEVAVPEGQLHQVLPGGERTRCRIVGIEAEGHLVTVGIPVVVAVGVERIGAVGVDFVPVGQAVVVRIRVGGIRPVLVLLQVGKAVGVGVF